MPVIAFACIACGKKENLPAGTLNTKVEIRDTLGRAWAQKELEESLHDTTLHNVVGSEHLIKDSSMAIAIAEPILFNIYGKDNITGQRPYEAYLINNYWVLKGTLIASKGGTFLIIINAANGEIIRISHGK